MLALDSPIWGDLRHAYGAAGNIPELLRTLALDPSQSSDYREEPWFTLWSSLCHQGDVNTASYAAVPHLVDICRNAQMQVDSSFFQLPACIEISRANGNGPSVLADLLKDYESSLSTLHECAFKQATFEWSKEFASCVAAALAAAKGQIRLAEAILNLDDDAIVRLVEGEV